MSIVEALRREAELAYGDLRDTLAGVLQEETWAVAPLLGRDYLHTEGSILGIVQHVATCKVMYASAGFRGADVRWRDCADRLDALGPSWEPNQAYLAECQDYWMSAWEALVDGELDRLRPTNWGEQWPTWRLIATITQHDAYHAGQTALLRAQVLPSGSPPPTHSATIREVLTDHPTY